MQTQIAERIRYSSGCSSSNAPVDTGPLAMHGGCVGSKRSMSAAVKRRQALYEPALKLKEPQRNLPGQTPVSLESQSDSNAREDTNFSRRNFLHFGSSTALMSLATRPAKAVSMPRAFDNAWSAVGGGPADLTFPIEFLGQWVAESTLSNIEMPLGPDFVPNPLVVERAKREDLKKKIRYEVSYIKNKKGKIIIDRRFNTASLMNVYLGQGVVDAQGVSWNPDDPNRLSFQLPGGTNIVTRVVRRSEEQAAKDRINTSEFFEQVFQVPDRIEPKVKASQCFTKYKWRSPQEAAQTGGPLIVATQVVSDYLTPYDGEGLMLRAQNKPVVVYTYNMTFRRVYKSYEV